MIRSHKAWIGIVALVAPCVGGCTSIEGDYGEGSHTDNYTGKSVVKLPDGRSLPGGDILARRTLRRADSTIVEQVVTASGPPGSPPREFIVDMTVSGSTLTMKERGGAFTGTGTLTGPAWSWTAWRTESVLADGMRVVSEDKVTLYGLRAEKTVFDPSGSVRVRIVEELTPISAEEFAKRRAELLGPAAAR